MQIYLKNNIQGVNLTAFHQAIFRMFLYFFKLTVNKDMFTLLVDQCSGSTKLELQCTAIFITANYYNSATEL